MENSIEVWVKEEVEKGREYHYWYGGTKAEIKVGNYTLLIDAIGDVRATLYDCSTGDILFDVKDKNNAGVLGWELDTYIKDDQELQLLLDGKHPNYEIVFENNNWWECFVIDEHGNFHDLMWNLDSYGLGEAINEVLSYLRFIQSNEQPLSTLVI